MDLGKALDWNQEQRAEAYKRGQRDRANNFPSAEDKEAYEALAAYCDGYAGKPLGPAYHLGPDYKRGT